jgi:hypothetical protein
MAPGGMVLEQKAMSASLLQSVIDCNTSNTSSLDEDDERAVYVCSKPCISEDEFTQRTLGGAARFVFECEGCSGHCGRNVQQNLLFSG